MFKKQANGEYTYYKKNHTTPEIIVRSKGNGGGQAITSLQIPAELVGKRVRIVLRVMEDRNEKVGKKL